MPLFFGSSGQRVEQGASEARKRPGGAFVARCACRGTAVLRASLVARSKKEVTTYVVTSFLDSGRKLKCSGEVNSPSAKILRRKMLVRRKSAGFAIRGTFHSAAPCPHMKFANTDAPATVRSPATTIDRPLIAPSTSPSSMALAVPSACAAEPMLTPFAMGSVI